MRAALPAAVRPSHLPSARVTLIRPFGAPSPAGRRTRTASRGEKEAAGPPEGRRTRRGVGWGAGIEGLWRGAERRSRLGGPGGRDPAVLLPSGEGGGEADG